MVKILKYIITYNIQTNNKHVINIKYKSGTKINNFITKWEHQSYTYRDNS